MMGDPLIRLLVVVVVVGLIVYLARMILDAIPMDERIRNVGYVLILVIAILYILRAAMAVL